MLCAASVNKKGTTFANILGTIETHPSSAPDSPQMETQNSNLGLIKMIYAIVVNILMNLNEQAVLSSLTETTFVGQTSSVSRYSLHLAQQLAHLERGRDQTSPGTSGLWPEATPGP